MTAAKVIPLVLVDDNHSLLYCRKGQAQFTCRYLILSGGGWFCGKDHKHLKATIDDAYDTEIWAKHPTTTKATGDNCPGYGPFKELDGAGGATKDQVRH